jgi:hypothetical protein
VSRPLSIEYLGPLCHVICLEWSLNRQEIKERRVIVKSKRIVLLTLILVSLGIISSSVFAAAADKDKYSEWTSPSEGVSFRYGRTYLGENQWSPYPNFVQFWNGNAYRVKITYYETLAGKEYGPYIHFLSPSSDKDPGIKVAIPKDAKVSSITVERLQ